MVANLETGGQQRMALMLAEEFRQMYNIYFLVFTREYQYGHYNLPQDVEVIDLHSEPVDGKIQKIFNVKKRARAVKSIKKSKHIDYAISFGESANIVNCLTKGEEKVITSIRSSLVLQTGARNIDRMIMHCSDKIVFISHGQKEAYADCYPKYRNKMAVIYNACEAESIAELSREDINEDMDEWTFTAVGRLVRVKCFRNLIDSFGIVLTDYPQLKLLIIGDGELRDELEEYVKVKGLEDQIKMLGNSENPFAYVSKSRALLNPSGSESFSNVVLEGLACGVPVIATDCRFGPREILSDNFQYGLMDGLEITDNGILTPSFIFTENEQPEREKIFADAIKLLLEDKQMESRFRENAKNRVQKFSLESYKKEWGSLLQGV